jgi:hypothetical protein
MRHRVQSEPHGRTPNRNGTLKRGAAKQGVAMLATPCFFGQMKSTTGVL